MKLAAGPESVGHPSLETLLLTGHTGFVGRTILSGGITQFGRRFRVAMLPEAIDIGSPDLGEAVAAIHPSGVLHLAALTSVADSFRDAERYFAVNFHGTWNLLRALHDAGFDGRFVYVSTGDAYGSVPEAALPVREDFPLRPRSPYAVAKGAAEMLCRQWSETERLDVVIARPFNHIGPGQDARFAVASFARQIALIAAGLAPPRLSTGDLDVTRDFTDVRDVVDAYVALFASGRTAEVYNVGTGRETRVGDVLARLIAIAGVKVETTTDPARIRPDEQRRAVADVTKIGNDTGWHAATPLDRTLEDTLEYWKTRITNE
jgi:GDP-4-dehydro-6-deoxy-D-mannose reductase